MTMQGRITDWQDARGFGFVTPSSGGDRVFVHVSAFVDRSRRPVNGDLVTCDLSRDRSNRTSATNVRYRTSRSRNSRPAAATDRRLNYLIAGSFGLGVLALAMLGTIPPELLFAYLGFSGAVFVVYAFDKAAAMQQRWRTRESTLHVLSVLGGWPGALVAQRMFRHKSNKAAFQATFRVTAALNCAVLFWFATKPGAASLSALLGGR
ncbi:MAG: cold shock and DUF1294 domain-containing protein [Gammaproteobacteria bacterium]